MWSRLKLVLLTWDVVAFETRAAFMRCGRVWSPCDIPADVAFEARAAYMRCGRVWSSCCELQEMSRLKLVLRKTGDVVAFEARAAYHRRCGRVWSSCCVPQEPWARLKLMQRTTGSLVFCITASEELRAQLHCAWGYCAGCHWCVPLRHQGMQYNCWPINTASPWCLMHRGAYRHAMQHAWSPFITNWYVALVRCYLLLCCALCSWAECSLFIFLSVKGTVSLAYAVSEQFHWRMLWKIAFFCVIMCKCSCCSVFLLEVR